MRGAFNAIAVKNESIVDIIRHAMTVLYVLESVVRVVVVSVVTGMMDSVHMNDVKKRMKYTDDCVYIGCCCCC